MEFFDRQGEPISRDEWVRLLNDRDYQSLRKDDIGSYRVSTVWIGLDHNFGFGEPLIFETMVFGIEDTSDLAMRRYTTEEDALAGHDELLEEWSFLVAVEEVEAG